MRTNFEAAYTALDYYMKITPKYDREKLITTYEQLGYITQEEAKELIYMYVIMPEFVKE